MVDKIAPERRHLLEVLVVEEQELRQTRLEALVTHHQPFRPKEITGEMALQHTAQVAEVLVLLEVTHLLVHLGLAQVAREPRHLFPGCL